MWGWTRWSTLFYTDGKNKYQATKFQIAYKAPGVLRYSKITILGLSPNQGILTPTVNDTDLSPSAGRDAYWSNGRRLPWDPDCITALTGHFTLKHGRWVSNKHHGWNVYQEYDIHKQQLLHTYLQCYTQALTVTTAPVITKKYSDVYWIKSPF